MLGMNARGGSRSESIQSRLRVGFGGSRARMRAKFAPNQRRNRACWKHRRNLTPGSAMRRHNHRGHAHRPHGQRRAVSYADGTAFVALMIDGHRETWPIRSARFRTWFRHRYYKAAGSPPSAGVIGSALDLLEARAQFDGPRQEISVRTGEHGGSIYLDLADELWRAVEITPDGWEVISCPPVRFRRAAGAPSLHWRGGAAVKQQTCSLPLRVNHA